VIHDGDPSCQRSLGGFDPRIGGDPGFFDIGRRGIRRAIEELVDLAPARCGESPTRSE
jgi:hypothetical protein